MQNRHQNEDGCERDVSYLHFGYLFKRLLWFITEPLVIKQEHPNVVKEGNKGEHDIFIVSEVYCRLEHHHGHGYYAQDVI